MPMLINATTISIIATNSGYYYLTVERKSWVSTASLPGRLCKLACFTLSPGRVFSVILGAENCSLEIVSVR